MDVMLSNGSIAKHRFVLNPMRYEEAKAAALRVLEERGITEYAEYAGAIYFNYLLP